MKPQVKKKLRWPSFYKNKKNSRKTRMLYWEAVIPQTAPMPWVTWRARPCTPVRPARRMLPKQLGSAWPVVSSAMMDMSWSNSTQKEISDVTVATVGYLIRSVSLVPINLHTTQRTGTTTTSVELTVSVTDPTPIPRTRYLPFIYSNTQAVSRMAAAKEVEDEMIQCVICEDWYHGRHLGSKVPDNDNYDEMICDSCMKKNDFLRFYSVQCKETVTVVKAANSSGSKHVEVEKTSPEKKASMTVTSASVSQGTDPVTPDSSLYTNSTATPTPVSATGSVAAGVKRERNSDVPKPLDSAKPSPKVPTSTEISSSNDTYESKNSVCGDTNAESSNPVNAPCVLGDLRQRNVEGDKLSATFWLAGWRSKLCTCSKCKEMYAEAKIAFLLDECDPVHVYEAKAPAQECSQYDRGMQALSQLDRVQQVEALHEFNDLQTELKDYLKKFAENGKVVREEDIKEFFTQMSARKRQKAASGGMQYFCK